MAAPLIIHQFSALSDNYGYLVHSPGTNQTAAIDTPQADKIIEVCQDKGWKLTHIWNTHHHFDHVGGNLELKARFNVEIIGNQSDKDRIPGLTKGVSGGDVFQFGGHDVRIFDTPGHTIGHICYYIAALDTAFVGDTLFALGCGRLFEGTPLQMYDSLAKLAALPEQTRLYCAHEYTLSNGRFALSIDPNNTELNAYMQRAQKLRNANLPTVPSTLAQEKTANPFLRAQNAKELGRIRALKDNFKG